MERLRSIVARLAAHDPRGTSSDGMERLICTLCGGGDARWAEPGDWITTNHTDTRTTRDGDTFETTESLAHHPDCLWLAARKENPC